MIHITLLLDVVIVSTKSAGSHRFLSSTQALFKQRELLLQEDRYLWFSITARSEQSGAWSMRGWRTEYCASSSKPAQCAPVSLADLRGVESPLYKRGQRGWAYTVHGKPILNRVCVPVSRAGACWATTDSVISFEEVISTVQSKPEIRSSSYPLDT